MSFRRLRSLKYAALFSLTCSLTNASNKGLGTPASWKHSAVFLSDARIDTLKDRIAQRLEPNFTAWGAVKTRCDRGLYLKPRPVENWAIPGFYDGHSSHEQAVEGLKNDSVLAYEEALCFRITGDTKYARQSARLLNAWATTLKTADPTQVDTKLSMSEFFTAMIVAADLLDQSTDWPADEKQRFKKFVREIVLPLNTMEPKKNNHANWGTLLVLCVASYLDDLELLERAEKRFKALIDLQIGEDGTMVFEYDRSDTNNWHGGPTRGKSGIWYSNYALMPTTLSAEVLYLNGRDLFDFQSPSGKTLKMAFERIVMWTVNPESFPFYKSNHGELKGTTYVSYFEVLNRHWPNEGATQALQRLRPLSSEAGLPDLTLTHGGF